MRGRSSGKTAPPATRASPGKAGGLKDYIHCAAHFLHLSAKNSNSRDCSPMKFNIPRAPRHWWAARRAPRR